MATIKVSLVEAEGTAWSGEVEMLIATTTEGEIGIQAGHEPLMALLVPGAVRAHMPNGETLRAAVHDGFLLVTGDSAQIITDLAEVEGEIDVDRAQRAYERSLTDPTNPDNAAAHARARARLATVGITRI